MNKIKKPKLFTIDRSKWVNGNNISINNPSKLLNGRGNMCCLGFFSKACGVNKEQIKEVHTPHLLYITHRIKLPSMLHRYNITKTCELLIACNDDGTMTQEARESRIKSLFKRIGVTVKFIN